MAPSSQPSNANSAKKMLRVSLLHPDDSAFEKALSKIASESKSLGGAAPNINAILKWMGHTIRAGVEGGFLRKKMVRNDLEILKDREANWIEYCVLFYSLSRRLGVECYFGVFEAPDSDMLSDEDHFTYNIFAKEGGRTVTISPVTGYAVEPEEKLIKRIDAAEFFRRISILSSMDIFSLIHTTPLLYYVYGDLGLWLYRPEPGVLLQSFIGHHGPVLDLRCIFASSLPQHFDFTLIDYKHSFIFTTSPSELRKFSAKPPKGFKVSSMDSKDSIFKLVRSLVGRKYSSVILGRNMQKLLVAFAKDARGHYDPSYV